MTRTLTFAEAAACVEAARQLADLPGGADAYRSFAKLVHPDVAPAGQEGAAARAFRKLTALRDRTDLFGALVAAGDIANLYASDDGLLKIPRDPADNDLLAAEAEALGRLARDGDPKYRPYAPRLLRTFTHEDEGGRRRTVNVLERLDGFVPLTAIGRRIDARDAAWMWRRLLVALGWAHRAGVVHGAVLPEHVLIHPAEHGVALVDWCYAVAPGQPARALVAARRDDYPPEVAARRPPSAATDIYLATRTMIGLVDRPPAALRRFADGCCLDAPRMRPQDAWRLLTEFDELLENLYGRRTFRPFRIQ